MQTLAQWAESNKLSYHAAYNRYRNGTIGVDVEKTSTGTLIIKENSDTIAINKSNSFHDNISKNDSTYSGAVAIYDESEYKITKAGSTRLNEVTSIRPQDRFANIQNSIIPFRYSGSGYGSTDVSIRDAVILCQQMYWSFAAFSNTIRLFVEFAVGDIFFKSKNKKAKEFFAEYWDRINHWSLQEKFYLEYWRSGNVFIWPILGQVKEDEFIQLIKQFGANTGGNKLIPLRYTILNPADIIAEGSVSFTIPNYKKLLSDYELERFRNPRTPEDQEIFNSLDTKVKEQIKSSKKTSQQFYIDLPKENILAIFNFKQDYEAFAVPMGYCILEAVNLRKEIQKIDQALIRTIQQAVLHFKVGAELKDGKIHLQKQQVTDLENIFKNGSVARVLITDFSVDGKFIVPDVNNLLDARRYDDVNYEIQQGLRNVFLTGGGGDKFANQMTKVELFIQGINHARQIFKREFLIPEIKRIKRNLGIKGKIEAEYEEIDLKNELEYAKIYTRMAELGLITADELFLAVEKGILPTADDSEENQIKFKEQKDKKLYEPLLNKKVEEDGAGRPGGTKSPQSTKKISPIGASLKFSGSKLIDTMEKYNTLQDSVSDIIKKENKLKKLTEYQKSIAKEIGDIILFNEDKEKWTDEGIILSYLKSPVDKNQEKLELIGNISTNHQLELKLAAFLSHSIVQ